MFRELPDNISYPKIEENIHGLQIIKSYTTEKATHRNFEDSNNLYFKSMNKMLYLRELSSPVSEIIGSFVIIAIMWYGSVLILEEQSMDQAMFFTYILLFYQIITANTVFISSSSRNSEHVTVIAIGNISGYQTATFFRRLYHNGGFTNTCYNSIAF